MMSVAYRITSLLLYVSVLQSSTTDIRQLLLFPKKTTWNHAKELCESVGMELVTVNSPDVHTAMEVFDDSDVWTDLVDYWMGLHKYDVYRETDYLWADCRTLIPQGWTPGWKDEGNIHERCGRTRGDKKWEMKKCHEKHGEVVCQNFTQGQCSFTAFDDHSFDVSESPLVNLTTRNLTSFNDCKLECMDHTSSPACWGIMYESSICSLYLSETMTNVYNTLEEDSDVTAYIRLCYIGILDERHFTVKYTDSAEDNEPWKGCDAPLGSTTNAPSSTESTTSAPATTESTTSAPATTESTTSAPSPTESTTSTPATTESTTSAPATTESTTSAPATTESTSDVGTTTLSAEPTSTAELSSTFIREETTTGSKTTTTASRTTESKTGSVETTESASVVPDVPELDVEVCLCTCRIYPNLSMIEKEEILEGIITNLIIDTRKISSTRRKYESIYDPRPSAQVIGGAGVAILALTFGLLFLLDMTALSRDLGHLWNKIQRK